MKLMNLQSPQCLIREGTILHELLHVCGFHHEQNREDRDNYVKIYEENIRYGTESNFEKVPVGTTTGYGISYDYGSILHYSQYSFSINGKPTIVPKVCFFFFCHLYINI